MERKHSELFTINAQNYRALKLTSDNFLPSHILFYWEPGEGVRTLQVGTTIRTN